MIGVNVNQPGLITWRIGMPLDVALFGLWVHELIVAYLSGQSFVPPVLALDLWLCQPHPGSMRTALLPVPDGQVQGVRPPLASATQPGVLENLKLLVACGVKEILSYKGIGGYDV